MQKGSLSYRQLPLITIICLYHITARSFCQAFFTNISDFSADSVFALARAENLIFAISQRYRTIMPKTESIVFVLNIRFQYRTAHVCNIAALHSFLWSKQHYLAVFVTVRLRLAGNMLHQKDYAPLFRKELNGKDRLRLCADTCLLKNFSLNCRRGKFPLADIASRNEYPVLCHAVCMADKEDLPVNTHDSADCIKMITRPHVQQL